MNKKNIIATLMLAICGITATWAQGDLTPNANNTVWTTAMPAYDIELQAEYYTDLDENAVIDYSDIQNTTADVWMIRTLASGSYNTLALPFNITVADFKTKIGDAEAEVKELNSSSVDGSTLTMKFTDATTIEAGKPYLVKLSGGESITLGAFDGVTMPETVEGQTVSKEGVDFIGTVKKTTLPDDKEKILFLATGNTLKNPSANGQNLKGFRAYFQLTDANPARSIRLFFDDKPTGIKTVSDVKGKISYGWYDLEGRRINGEPTQKGVYIVNGKKIIK